MKTMLMSLAFLLSLSSFAASTGVAKVSEFTFEGVKNLRIEITGTAAKKLFDELKVEVISIDASESPNRAHTMIKPGKNYSCQLIMTKVGTYKCSISTLNKTEGSVDEI